MIWNIIDRRKRPHRWASVHVVVEATANDNSVEDSDKAPPYHAVIFVEERDKVSLSEAIAWASGFELPTTLYIYDDEELADEGAEEDPGH